MQTNSPGINNDYIIEPGVTAPWSLALDVQNEFIANPLNFPEDGQEKSLEDYLGGILTYSRACLETMDDKKSQLFDSYMNSSAPDYLKNLKEDNDGLSSWKNWLVDDGNAEQFMNFLQWHSYVREQQKNDPSLHAEIQKQRELYKANVTKGVEEGWLSSEAQSAIQKIDKIEIFIGDTFDTIIEGNSGYHKPGDDHIVLANGNGTLKIGNSEIELPKPEDSFVHEMNHAVLGSESSKGLLSARWINEALTEHIAQAFIAGSVSAVSPTERPDDEYVYAEERAILAFLLADGAIKIDPALATRAYSGTEEDRQHFYDALNESWQMDVLTTMNAIVNKIEQNKGASANLLEPVLEGFFKFARLNLMMRG